MYEHYDPDTPTPLPPCHCAHCRSEGRIDMRPDCIHWRSRRD